MRPIAALSRLLRARIRPESPAMNFSLSSMLRTFALWLLFACGTHAQAANDAAFVSQSVPTSMVAGSVYNVSITMRNTGTTPWSAAGNYLLGAQNPENNFTWRYPRVPVPASIAPGGQATFTFQVTAPPTPGTYNFQWHMVQEYVQWFGPYTPNVAVTVSRPANGAQVIGTSVPAAMTQGQIYPITVTMKNTGGTTWAAGTAYPLGSANPLNNMTWGVGRVNLVSAVPPGQQYTFAFNVMAPAAGSYAMGWRMLQEGVEWFGGTSNSPVTVSAPAQAPSISVTRTPNPMTAGQAYTLSWSSANATSLSRVCTSSGTGYTISDAPALSGTSTGTASAAWVGYPSACTWRATGAGGTASFTETMTTSAAPTSEVVTYIHTDGLGSPVARSNASGVVISRTRYEPYGLTAEGATPTIGFTGHVNDADTGLVYMQQRYYDPVAGRFLSVDPVTTDANIGGRFNRYSYANNSPYKYIDPDGRSAMIACVGGPIPCVVGAGVTVVAAVAIVIKGQEVLHGSSNAAPKKQEGSSPGATPPPLNSDSKNVGISSTLPKPPAGPGSVPKADRDPKRYFTPGEREAKRGEQGHKCGNGCGTDIDHSNSAGHHEIRHADGGPTTPENHVEVCRDCHDELHNGQ